MIRVKLWVITDFAQENEMKNRTRLEAWEGYDP